MSTFALDLEQQSGAQKQLLTEVNGIQIAYHKLLEVDP